jgi:hypothetical protein
MSVNEAKMKELLKSTPKGEKIAGDLHKIMNKVGTDENLDFLRRAQNSPQAAKAAQGDTQAMTELLGEIMKSRQGQDLVQQIKQMTGD